MNDLIVFLCTPRSGTQWFASNLQELYSGVVEPVHEPIGMDYFPRLNIGRPHESPRPEGNSVLADHIDRIQDVLRQKKYIEVGWQSIAGVYALHRRFGGQLKLVHLLRHPVNVAASLVTHGWYAGNGERAQKAELTPFDEGVKLGHYRQRWQNMDAFEKGIYHWTETHLAALDIAMLLPGVEMHRIRFEDVFENGRATSRSVLQDLIHFFELDWREEVAERVDIKRDNHRFTTTHVFEQERWKTHPFAVGLAEMFGYDPTIEHDLSRYAETGPIGTLKRIVKRTYKEITGSDITKRDLIERD